MPRYPANLAEREGQEGRGASGGRAAWEAPVATSHSCIWRIRSLGACNLPICRSREGWEDRGEKAGRADQEDWEVLAIQMDRMVQTALLGIQGQRDL